MEIETQPLPEGGIIVYISNIKCDTGTVKGFADAAACLVPGMKFSRCFYENDYLRFRLRDGDFNEFWNNFNRYRHDLGLE